MPLMSVTCFHGASRRGDEGPGTDRFVFTLSQSVVKRTVANFKSTPYFYYFLI